MPQPGEPAWPGTWERVLPVSGELEPSPEVLSTDLAHLFDYCRALLGEDGEAARIARSALDSRLAALPDPDHIRASIFAHGRTQALAECPSGGDRPSYMPAALTAASSQKTDNGVLRAFTALTDSDREILDLVYRHGIRAASLPEVLGIPAAEAYRRLAIAEEEFVCLVADPSGSDTSPAGEAGAKLEDIAALPVATLPAAEGSERQPADLPAPRLEGVAPRRSATRRHVLFAAVIPVAAILAGIALFAAPGHSGMSHRGGVLAFGGANQATQQAGTHGARSHQSRDHTAPFEPVHLGRVVTPTALPEPISSPAGPAIAGFTLTVNPVPCPAGTKANFRWHYAANSSPGGWSETATYLCPGSLTMGPQAMGNLQVTPGTTLQAGYDFTLPGNNNSLTMTVSAAKVTFAVSCVSKAAPSASSLTVPLQAQTYQITGSQWYPSGDQSSPLVYQGLVPVPALCGPGGAISLAKGGTFTATLG